MVQIEMKGVHRVVSKGREYYYAWRGGPRLVGEPGSTKFIASYEAAHAVPGADEETFEYVIRDYKTGAFLELALTTRKTWAPWIDKISIEFGALSLRVANATDKMRPLIRDWRNQWSTTPRAVDTGLQVLSVIMAHGIDPMGKILHNPVDGIKRLYTVDRSEIIWEPDDLLAFRAIAPLQVWWAVALAAFTGLRQGDLVRLPWSAIKNDQIFVKRTSKTGASAYIPLYGELVALLAEIPKHGPADRTDEHVGRAVG